MGAIFLVPFFGQGHLFPCMELCKHLSSRNYQTTLVVPSHLSSSIPSSLRNHPSVQISQIPSASTPPPQEQFGPGYGHNPLMHNQNLQLGQGIELLLRERSESQSQTRPVCAVVDVMMSWSKDIFAKFDVPVVSFFTSGACSAAMEYAAWKIHAHEMKPGETRILPGLPESMALTYSDLQQRPPPKHRGFKFPRPVVSSESSPEPNNQTRSGPPGPGHRPRWLDETEGSIALLINTCSDLERSLIDYLAIQVQKPVWGVGPQLPEQYWISAGSLLHDNEIRSGNRQSNYSENQVKEWLNLKPRGSVLYISFGSEVGPTMEEYGELANALEKSNRPFIWVIQPGSGKPGPPRSLFGDVISSDSKEDGFYPQGLEDKIGDRGLIICGWAPQLLILSHQSTGAFLSHCGWNSLMEAIGRGVPILTWPIRGDQFDNAKLIAAYLKVGCMMPKTSDGTISSVNEKSILQGIDNLMGDEDVRSRATALGTKFEFGFPASSVAALDAFSEFIRQ